MHLNRLAGFCTLGPQNKAQALDLPTSLRLMVAAQAALALTLADLVSALGLACWDGLDNDATERAHQPCPARPLRHLPSQRGTQQSQFGAEVAGTVSDSRR